MFCSYHCPHRPYHALTTRTVESIYCISWCAAWSEYYKLHCLLLDLHCMYPYLPVFGFIVQEEGLTDNR
jgi:hypothetical protein